MSSHWSWRQTVAPCSCSDSTPCFKCCDSQPKRPRRRRSKERRTQRHCVAKQSDQAHVSVCLAKSFRGKVSCVKVCLAKACDLSPPNSLNNELWHVTQNSVINQDCCTNRLFFQVSITSHHHMMSSSSMPRRDTSSSTATERHGSPSDELTGSLENCWWTGYGRRSMSCSEQALYQCLWRRLRRSIAAVLDIKGAITRQVNDNTENGLHSMMHDMVEQTWVEPWHVKETYRLLETIMQRCTGLGEREDYKAVCRCVGALCKLRFPSPGESPDNQEGVSNEVDAAGTRLNDRENIEQDVRDVVKVCQ